MACTGLLMQVSPITLYHLSQIALVSLIEFNPDNYDCKESKYFNDDWFTEVIFFENRDMSSAKWLILCSVLKIETL